MYSWYFFYLSQISLKNSFGKVFIQIFADIKMMQNEKKKSFICLPFEMVQIFYFILLFAGIWLWLVYIYIIYIYIYIYIYGVEIILKNCSGKVVFLGWVPWNPLISLGQGVLAGYFQCWFFFFFFSFSSFFFSFFFFFVSSPKASLSLHIYSSLPI